MKCWGFKKIMPVLATLMLIFACALPTAAFAANSQVQIDNHTVMSLDDKAQVSSAEGETWEIPVLWVGDDLNVATEAVEGRRYLPALVFFVPQGCTVEGGAFTVTLSDSVAKLFGTEDIISIYDPNSGVTYILPASLRDFFSNAREQTQENDRGKSDAKQATGQDTAQAAEQTPEQPAEESPDASAGPTQIEIHCAQTARDALTDEDLEWLIDLVKNKLEPQAVNLLISKFPAFSAAAANRELGREIGLYIYYEAGDKDGIFEHEHATEALAFVRGDSVMKDGVLTYCYMIGVDVSDLVAIDEDEDPIRNATTGKLSLVRSGTPLETLCNTVVHELFHAFMDDYNRTGMLGAKSVQDGYTPGDKFINDAQKERYLTLRFPIWFLEGTASAVENVYQFRYDDFQKLRETIDSPVKLKDMFEREELVYNYRTAEPSYDLELSATNDTSTVRGSYVTGYLATLYLSELAAQRDPAIGSAKSSDGSFSSEGLRMGLNSILERLHGGETLDAVINDISKVGNGGSMYANTEDFQKRYIKGAVKGDNSYEGDNASIAFTLDFLNYMLSIERIPGRTHKPNGSILFDLADDYNLPVDPSKEASSDFYRIVDSSTFVPSTVPADVAFASGGKSESNTAAAASEAKVPMAAKAPSGEAEDVQAAIVSDSAGDSQAADTPDSGVDSQPVDAPDSGADAQTVAAPDPDADAQVADEPDSCTDAQAAAAPDSDANAQSADALDSGSDAQGVAAPDSSANPQVADAPSSGVGAQAVAASDSGADAQPACTSGSDAGAQAANPAR